MALKKMTYGYNKKISASSKCKKFTACVYFDAPGALHLPYLVVNKIHIRTSTQDSRAPSPPPTYTPELEFVNF